MQGSLFTKQSKPVFKGRKKGREEKGMLWEEVIEL